MDPDPYGGGGGGGGGLPALPHTPWLGSRGAPLPHPPRGGGGTTVIGRCTLYSLPTPLHSTAATQLRATLPSNLLLAMDLHVKEHTAGLPCSL